MQLIYLYINKYCNFHQAEFNFSPDICLHFDKETGKLTASDTQFRLPARFWGENINALSVVVGNNGAGKTSLMQAVIELFLDAHGHVGKNAQGILIFREGDTLFGYCNQEWDIAPVKASEGFKSYGQPRWLDRNSVKRFLGKTKLIYLTNALTMRDCQRSQWYASNRFAPLYDCSMGNLIVSDASKDANQAVRSGSLELESYLLSEQYKQIKFVFDRKQHRLCAELKNKGYPMPVPERLYIDLILENGLSSALDVDDYQIGDHEDFSSWEFDKKIFPDLYPPRNRREALREDPIWGDPYILLRKQLSRCAILCMVRSAASRMSDQGRWILSKFLEAWEPSTTNYTELMEKLWDEIDNIYHEAMGWWTQVEFERRKLKESCQEFIRFIETEKLEDHFKIESELWGAFRLDVDHKTITVSIDTTDTGWFMEFLEKYRRICDPHYFLDFRWGLSSGENSLLNLFASLYYVYGAYNGDPKNETYSISNLGQGNELVTCNSVILLIDEADLTYHPDWQRAFIDLLTAFLPRVYPPRFCRDIQVILSTHSPILLSDVPQQSVIYLNLDPGSGRTVVDQSVHGGTFGQNIHLLFKDSFFLTHGTIGCFAKRKIDLLFNTLKRIEDVLDSGKEGYAEEFGYQLEHEWRPYAELIAEPIIRRKALMWIEELEQKLSRRGADDRVRQLSDQELEREFSRLKRELDRRKYDTNSDL